MTGLIVISGCSTKKNTFTRRAYHNLTSHYNVYWNGMDQLRQGVKDYQSTIVDNYALILPVYNYGDKANTGKISQYSDIGITKASKAIQKHSMVFNRKEFVKWIDDAYFLIGKSYYYKQDYGMARRTFEFIIKTYNKNEIKYEAMLWLAMSNIQMKDFKRAEPMLDMLLNKITQEEAPEKFEMPVNLAYAQFNILQQKYNASVPYLQRAIELNPGPGMKTRCKFILGQIYQLNGDYDIATQKYKAVIKRNPSFAMEFNSKINMAQCYDTQSGDKEYIVKKLTKMLKDEKNKEVRDQIYYALAQVSLRDSDTIAGINYLALSVTSSMGNNYQKAISALSLADIYFAVPNYPLAQAYYDSTMQFLPASFPNYKEIKRKTSTLTDLVANLQIIQMEDSLQMLAMMSEADRNKKIDEIINKIVLEEQRIQIEEMQRRENPNLFGTSEKNAFAVSDSREGKWYFYNAAVLSSGFSTFIRKWGRRKLEDLWFLIDKNVIFFDDGLTEEDTSIMEGDTTAGKNILAATDPKKREYYLKDIPLTPELVDSSNLRIIDAYFNAGFIYIDGLKDYKNSIGSFETLLERFPKNEHEIPSYYELYILYRDLGNQPMSDQYRNLILNQFPETDYAKLLINPDYYKEIQKQKSQAAKLYEETWLAFNNQQYYMVLHNADLAFSEFPSDTGLIPRFEYLRALALGKVEVVDSLVIALQAIVNKYPTHQVKPLAANILAYLSQQKNPKGDPVAAPDATQPVDPSEKLYTYYPNSIHFFILIVDGSRIDVNAMKVKMSDFNSKYFRLDELQVNSLLLDNTKEMITVNNFYDAQKAVDYYLSIKDSPYVYNVLENVGNFSDFVISVENYPVFYKNKDTDLYKRFFGNNYNSLGVE